MSKIMKKISLSLIGIFAFLIAGVFFAGCGVDYDKIRLVSNVSSIEIEVGQTEELVFTIEGYQKGFSNKIQLDIKNSGQTQIVEYEENDIVYVSNTEIRVKITGKAGGNGIITARTLEGDKQAEVSVSVVQNSNSMEFDDRLLYVSNDTDFVPTSDMFIFDGNTTNKQISYYYIKQRTDFNFDTSYLVEIDTGVATGFYTAVAKFTDGKGNFFYADVLLFDSVSLARVTDGAAIVNYLQFFDEDVLKVELAMVGEFSIMAVYDYSVNNPEEYKRIVFDTAEVQVLPNIDMKVYGGYFANDGNVANNGLGYVDFEEINISSTQKHEIIVVPNNKKMLQYVLKVEMVGSVTSSPLEIEKLQENNYLDIDFIEYEEKPGVVDNGYVVYYFRVSHNSQTQAKSAFSINVFYDVAQGIDDASVNVEALFLAEIKIAPNAITVNGTIEPDDLTLYNYYKYPEFGWNELVVDVVSGFESSPNFEGVYFTCPNADDEQFLDLIYDGVSVDIGNSDVLYTDLSKPFYIRGKFGKVVGNNCELQVHAKSNILEDGEELAPVTITCKIIAGATSINIDDRYTARNFSIDSDLANQEFYSQIYADQAFQSVSYKLLGGLDIVNIELDYNGDGGKPYNFVDYGGLARYYIRLRMTPKMQGTGVYRIYLDNGMPIDLTFNAVKTLSAQTTTIKLADSSNEAVTDFYFESDGAEYDNVINIDILNPSDRQVVEFGNPAYVEVFANVTSTDSIQCEGTEDSLKIVSVSKIGERFRFATVSNGVASIVCKIEGTKIVDFRSEIEKLEYEFVICSYSLVSEYYLKNGDSYAIDNAVYYGPGVQKADQQVAFTAVANNLQAKSFYAYEFNKESLVDFYENAGTFKETVTKPDGSLEELVRYNYSVGESDCRAVLNRGTGYDKKFIYFYAKDVNGAMQTILNAKITKTSSGPEGSGQKEVGLVFENGLMFMPDGFEYTIEDAAGNFVTYAIVFEDTVYSIGTGSGRVATFDMSTFLFTYTRGDKSYHSAIQVQSHLRQPNQTKRYDARIHSVRYQPVEGIALATNVDSLEFTNKKLIYELSVYTYPSDSTNKGVSVEFIRTNNNPYADLVKWDIDASEKEIGVYKITFSCEDFYQSHLTDLLTIEDFMTGKIYIYPTEWANSYTEISGELLPICLNVQYRNGSRANPYLIETAEDVLAINSNEITLKSHYEITSVIDMSNCKNATPIGILDGNVVGFSGSIIGANSQAAITNIFVSDTNFTSNGYFGLFAKVNAGAELENIQLSGEVQIESAKTSNLISVGVALNQGFLTNVGVKVLRGSIEVEQNSAGVYFGALAGVNNGVISQDFSKFDGTEKKYARYGFSQIVKGGTNSYYVEDEGSVYAGGGSIVFVDEFGYVLNGLSRAERDESDVLVRDYTGQNSKVLAYYNDFVSIKAGHNAIVVAGGIVGASDGVLQRIKAGDKYKVYGYGEYAAYTLLKVEAEGSASQGYAIVGGAVGAQVNVNAKVNGYGILPATLAETKYYDNKICEILVGGEVSTVDTERLTADFVGGIVGRIDTSGISAITVENCISRTFLRAIEYVGGIAGSEFYFNGYGAGNLATYKGNKIEAVDDGRNAFYSAMIIKFSNVNFGPVAKNSQYKMAIGNHFANGRSYDGFTSVDYFDSCSYLQRGTPLATGESTISTNVNSTTSYYGDFLICAGVPSAGVVTLKTFYAFETKDIDLKFVASGYEMTSLETDEVDVFFMNYFMVEESLSGNLDDDRAILENVNVHNPNSALYPFIIENNAVNIVAASSNILSIDVNGQIEVKGSGLATIQITSILNKQKSKTIYVNIVNYFDKNVITSLFYSGSSVNSINIGDGGSVSIYGTSTTNISLVPSYSLSSGHTYLSEEDVYHVTKAGILTYRNRAYKLAKNSELTVESILKDQYELDAEGNYVYVVGADGNLVKATKASYESFSKVQINKQTVVFYKSSEHQEGDVDQYELIPILQVNVQTDTGNYLFFYKLDGSAINLDVNYKETATGIRTQYSFHSMETNNFFKEKVWVTSENAEENLFYQIVKRDGDYEKIVQERLPKSVLEIEAAGFDWNDYIDFVGEDISNNLFNFDVTKTASNQFEIYCDVNVSSNRYKNRFEESIYGEYIVRLYANQLEDGVSCSFRLVLNEAEINYISINNYSNIKDTSITDSIVVPSQRGMLEIAVDPVEAVFEKIVVSNNVMNSLDGATNATFAFVYKKNSAAAGVEFVEAPNFGAFADGKFEFTYQELTDFYVQLNKYFDDNAIDASVEYNGKVYVSYYMPSYNVENMIPVGFDVEISYGNGGAKTMKSTALLKTKLKSFAKLSFVDKVETSGTYYVARGLSYQMALSSYGFEESQISISSSNSNVVSVEKIDGKYVLNVTNNTLNYNGETGFKIVVTTTATKVVDNVSVTTTDELEIYVMEYVVDYVYVEGQNEDLVNGMENGVISNAIGNPFDLEFAIRPFLEYDQTNPVVNVEVETFIKNMTDNIDWKVYFGGSEDSLRAGKTIRNDFYYINGLTVVPLRLYESESNIYHFSAGAYFKMKNGTYEYSSSSVNANKMYTEFSFDVHNQSTQDSPLPIETYEDLLDMKENEWYILLEDIVIPNENASTPFKPITANFAGFDGNGYSIVFSGNYSFSNVSNVGLFDTIKSGTTVKNVSVTLASDVVFKLDVANFNVGLLAALNEGVVTNCEVNSVSGMSSQPSLSVVSSVPISEAYVAGLVAENVGTISHSRSKIEMKSYVNMAGLVGKNSGTIASSAFVEGSLTNQTKTATEYTAGLVVLNSGKIYTSYVSGKQVSGTMYYDKQEDFIQSNNNLAGFVYENSGEVADCYSNIFIKWTGAFAAGFVLNNTGNVARCFSTSVLESFKTSNYGFAMSNKDEQAQGVIDSCFYLSDEDPDGDGDKENVNINISQITNDEKADIKPLKAEGFGEKMLEQNFVNFAYTVGRGIKSVWFYDNGEGDRSLFKGQEFNSGRIELVSANIIAKSKRQLDRIENLIDPQTGANYVEYVYIYDIDSAPLGSLYNPITIANAQEMETYILQENNAGGFNYSSYRLVQDIDYSQYVYNSKIYKTRFMGYFEGNFMTIRGMSLLSNEALEYAGMFAEVGNAALYNAMGTVMNFDFAPKVVSFANTKVVGSLAGKIEDATIVNINIVQTTSNVVVSGVNIVGGAIGLAVDDYKLQNVYSQLSAKARNQTRDDEDFSFDEELSDYSMAGNLAGALSGSGRAYNCRVDTSVSVLAGRAGLLFGYVDRGVVVEDVVVEMKDNSLVNAYKSGGLVVGETKGNFVNVEIVGNGMYFKNFKELPLTPTSIGGFAGRISGGHLKNISTTQSISTSTESKSSGVDNLGGIAGEVAKGVEDSATIFEDITVKADFVGYSYVGGVVGNIAQGSGVVRFVNVDVQQTSLSAQGRLQEAVAVGGLVGCLNIGSSISLGSSAIDVANLNAQISQYQVLKAELMELQKEAEDLENGVCQEKLDKYKEWQRFLTSVDDPGTSENEMGVIAIIDYCADKFPSGTADLDIRSYGEDLFNSFENSTIAPPGVFGSECAGLEKLLIEEGYLNLPASLGGSMNLYNAIVSTDHATLTDMKRDYIEPLIVQLNQDIAQLEDYIANNTSEQISLEADKKKGEVEEKITEISEAFEFNVLDVQVSMMVYLYDTSISASAGAVLGAIKGASSNVVEYTYSSIVGDCKVFDMSEVFESVVQSVKTNSVGDYDAEIVVSVPTGATVQYIVKSQKTAKMSWTYCDVDYEYAKTNEITELAVSLYGEAVVPPLKEQN